VSARIFSRADQRNNNENDQPSRGIGAADLVHVKRRTRSLNFDGERLIFQSLADEAARLHPRITYSAEDFSSFKEAKAYRRKTIFDRKRDIARYSELSKIEGAAELPLPPEWKFTSNHLRATSTILMAMARGDEVLSFTVHLGAEVMASPYPKAALGSRIAENLNKDQELREVCGKRPRFAFGAFEESNGVSHVHGWLIARRIPRRLEGLVKQALRRAGGSVPEDREQHQAATTEAYSPGAADYALKSASFTNVRCDDQLFISRTLLREAEEFYNRHRDQIRKPKELNEPSRHNELKHPQVKTDLSNQSSKETSLAEQPNSANDAPLTHQEPKEIDAKCQKNQSQQKPKSISTNIPTPISFTRCSMRKRLPVRKTPSRSPWAKLRIYGRRQSPNIVCERHGGPLAAGKRAIKPNSRPMLEWCHQAALVVYGVEPRPPPETALRLCSFCSRSKALIPLHMRFAILHLSP